MTKKKLISVASLGAVVVAGFCLQTNYVTAQSSLARKWREWEPPPPPARAETRAIELPVPTAARGPGTSRRPRVTFTFQDGRQITSRSRTSRFRLVGLRPGETVDVALQVSAPFPADSIMAQSLDGGKLISFSSTNIGSAGLASIRFQAGTQPGLYRVLVPGFGAPSLLQFWVADPNNPGANPPVVNPGH